MPKNVTRWYDFFHESTQKSEIATRKYSTNSQKQNQNSHLTFMAQENFRKMNHDWQKDV